MKVAVAVTNFLQLPVFIVRWTQVRVMAIAGVAGPTDAATVDPTTTPTTTSKSLAEDASKPDRIPRSARNRSERGAPRLRFWAILVWQTLTHRDLQSLSREMRDDFVTEGLENLPESGVFTLAVNHTLRRWTPRLLASLHHATLEKRPDLAADWLVIVGYREARLESKPWWVRKIVPYLRRAINLVWERWQHNTLRLPMSQDTAKVSIEALREWKTRARQQPTIVFPEGRGYASFREIRPGAGRWLAKLGGPVLPVSMWWATEEKRWHIIFGPAIEWSANSDLHDHQIGLEIATGLPPAEAPDWQADLDDWEQYG